MQGDGGNQTKVEAVAFLVAEENEDPPADGMGHPLRKRMEIPQPLGMCQPRKRMEIP